MKQELYHKIEKEVNYKEYTSLGRLNALRINDSDAASERKAAGNCVRCLAKISNWFFGRLSGKLATNRQLRKSANVAQKKTLLSLISDEL